MMDCVWVKKKFLRKIYSYRYENYINKESFHKARKYNFENFCMILITDNFLLLLHVESARKVLYSRKTHSRYRKLAKWRENEVDGGVSHVLTRRRSCHFLVHVP